MTWFFVAILGHTLNGVAMVIDKILLRNAFRRSATYAGLVGIFSFLALAVLPWVESWPAGTMLFIAFLSGSAFVFALRAFYASLKRSEASRIIPIVGSLIPIFTLAGTSVFLGERLAWDQGIGFAFLVLATIVLSSTGSKAARPSAATVAFAVIASFLFAVSFVAAKAVYGTTGFLGGFLATRLAAGGTAIVMLVILDRYAGREVLSLLRPKRASRPGTLKHAVALAIFGQSMGALGFIAVQYAISGGSAAIVNALQAVQYALIVLAALVFRSKARTLLGERMSGSAAAFKIFAIILTAIGLALVV